MSRVYRPRIYSILVIFGILALARLILSFEDGKFGGVAQTITNDLAFFSKPEAAQAHPDPAVPHMDVYGFAWTDTFGWISLNCNNYWSSGSLENRCAGVGGMDYGVYLEGGADCGVYPYNCLRGFAWSPNAGLICFGRDCNGDPLGAAVTSNATVYLGSGVAAGIITGFARVLNAPGDDGWIRLNGTEGGTSLLVRVVEGSDRIKRLSGLAWNKNLNGTGLGWLWFSGTPADPPIEIRDGLPPPLPPPSCTGSGSAEDCCCQSGRWSAGSVAGTACCLNPVSTCPLPGAGDCGECRSVDPDARPWLETRHGDIYARALTGTASAPSRAEFCIFSESTISHFNSVGGCARPESASMRLRYYPSPEVQESIALITGTNLLARIDIRGLINRRYGETESVSGLWDGPAGRPLAGKVYYYIDGDLTIGNSSSTMRFPNGGASTSGSGLLVVRGNLRIKGNIEYDPVALPRGAAISQLPSFGVVVTGNIIVESNVTDLVGAYLTAGTFDTGSTHRPLRIDGLVVANSFKLQRTCARRDIGSEIITYDGRAVANPPPGMADLVKALPTIRQTVP